jgi:hypothetical protein
VSRARWAAGALTFALGLGLGLGLFGCSNAGFVAASPAEHAAYRQTRVARTLDERLAAATAYLEAYPDGAYSGDVTAFVRRAEPLYFKSRQRTPEGLARYVEVLPKGAHAEEARSRLRALAALANRPDSLTASARRTEERLRRAQESREIARQEVAFWADLLLDPAVYRAPVASGPAELVTAFSLALPEPRCTLEAERRTCVKDVEFEYQVASPGGLTPRVLVLTIRLEEDVEGRPLRATLEGEELFLRLEETYQKRALDPGSEADLALALARALEVAAGAFASRVSAEPSCTQPTPDPGGPVLASYACEGMSLEVTRGAVDRFVFAPR